MIFKILRQEKHIFPIILVPLLIPNSFLWYYFEVVRHKKGNAGLTTELS